MAHPLLTLTCLPLFPLGTVLFPGRTVLPLRVFEVRYLDMVGRCHRAGAPFGVVALARGPGGAHGQARPQERLESVGTLARIAALAQPQPGLLLVECRGEQRFRIDSAAAACKHGLWVADASLAATRRAGRDHARRPASRRRAGAAAARTTALRRQRQRPCPPPATDALDYDDCGWVANRWCELLPLPTTAEASA
jgi:Lon protease-like protein